MRKLIDISGRMCQGLTLSLVLLLAARVEAAALDPGVQQLIDAFSQHGQDETLQLARGRGMLIREDHKVPVILEPLTPHTAQSMDTAKVSIIGGRVDARSRDYVRVLMPLAALHRLKELPNVRRVRLPIPAYPHAPGLGTRVSESVALTGAINFQNAGITGVGSKVAVVDLGFTGLANAIAQGELPGGTVSVDFTGTGIEASTNHGVGVAEHVMDMAPAAQLYCLKVGDELDLQNAADYIRNNGIQIANHSVGWVTSSYYDDTGPVNAIINASHDTDGVFWAVSAGNDRRNHWRSGWVDADADNKLEFSGSDELLDLSTASSSVSLFLNWDQYGNSVTDLDLYVRNKNNTVVASSTGPQTGTQEPVEIVSFVYRSTQAPYRIEIQRYSGTTVGLDMTIFSFYNELEYFTAASSLPDPSNAHGAYTVAAINQAIWNQANPATEYFSSQGPTTDGRMKPDIAAPDGTTSLTYGTTGSYGTSFSSPTTAGAAALLRAENPSRTANEIAALLTSMAIDIGATGIDTDSGAGKLNLTLTPVDSDGDGIADTSDNCPAIPNPEQTDTDGDGQGDACDTDDDDDGVPDNADNCPLAANANQADTDGDALGDSCDDDDDNDGLPDSIELLLGTSPVTNDTDGDGLSDYFEVNLDNDPGNYTPGTDLNPLSDDSDGDSLKDGDELSVFGTNPLSANLIGDIAPRNAPDGLLDVGDYALMMRLITGEIAPTSQENGLADMNVDGLLDFRDASQLRVQIMQQ